MGLFDRLRGDDDPRVVFLGIDGVPYDLIEDHPDVFENLHRIADAGTSGRIESIVPPESSACWPSLTTGVNPGTTGVYGFQDRDAGSYETYVPMGKDVRATRVWDRVTQAGRDATVLNVPVTFPPQTDVQRMVSGFLSPSVEDAASDPSVRRILETHDYQIDADAKLGHDADKSAFIENAHETLAARYDVFDHYISEDDWDLFFGVFMTTDRVNHFLFGNHANDDPEAEAFLKFYRQLDEYLGQIYDDLPEDVSLVIASDHGFTELEHEVNCNQWLVDHGYLSYDADDPDELADISPDTEVYSLIPGRFFINLEDREPAGSVSEDEYDAVRDRLIADLKAMTGPDRSPVCAQIHKGEDVFDGPATDIAPDVVVVPADGFDLKSGFKQKDAVFSTGPRNGMHKFSNACLFTDDDQISIEDTNLYDLTPTLLDLLEIDIEGAKFDGASLTSP